MDDQRLIGLPDTPPVVRVRVLLSMDGAPIELVRPVHYRYADRAQGERDRPLVVVPPVAVKLQRCVALFPTAAPAKVQVAVTGQRGERRGRAAAGSAAGLEGGAALAERSRLRWRASSSELDFDGDTALPARAPLRCAPWPP